MKQICLQGEKTNDKPSGYVSQYWQSNIETMNESLETRCTTSDTSCYRFTPEGGIIAYPDGRVEYEYNCYITSAGVSYCQ